MAAASGALAVRNTMTITITTNVSPPWWLGPITASWMNVAQMARCFQTSPP